MNDECNVTKRRAATKTHNTYMRGGRRVSRMTKEEWTMHFLPVRLGQAKKLGGEDEGG